MTATITATLGIVYLIAMASAFLAGWRQWRHELTLWHAALALAATAAAVNLVAAVWVNAGLWMFTTAMCVVNIHWTRRSLRDREIEAMWRARFERESI